MINSYTGKSVHLLLGQTTYEILTYIYSAFVGLDNKLYKMHGMYIEIGKMVFYRGHVTSHSLFDKGK